MKLLKIAANNKKMENLFFLEKIRTKDYPILVYSAGYHQISDYIMLLENNLRVQKYDGIVLFDLLLSNGLNNRFYTLIFNGEKFDYKSGKQVSALPANIVKKANSYQAKNKIGFANSILTKTELKKFEMHNRYNMH